MSYTAKIEGFEGQNIEVNVGFWTGPKLLINGEVAQKGSKRGEMLLQRNDGRQVIATWKPQALGLDVPQIIVDGKQINLVEPLKWYELVWSGLPALLIFAGGFIGAIAGMIGFAINTKLFRTDMNGFSKYLGSGLVSLMTWMIYFFIALMLSTLIRR